MSYSSSYSLSAVPQFLSSEVIMRKPEVFKMACLRDIQRLFGESARNPFYAGFGNRITDALASREEVATRLRGAGVSGRFSRGALI